jgi:excisionase family DNA binding protein
MDEQVLTPDEAAAFLKVGKQRVLRLARRGDVPSIRLGGRDVRFYVSDLIAIKRRTKAEAGASA